MSERKILSPEEFKVYIENQSDHELAGSLNYYESDKIVAAGFMIAGFGAMVGSIGTAKITGSEWAAMGELWGGTLLAFLGTTVYFPMKEGAKSAVSEAVKRGLNIKNRIFRKEIILPEQTLTEST